MPYAGPARGATGASASELEARAASRRRILERRGGAEAVKTEVPIYDTGRVKELQQEQTAAGLGRSRRGLREALSRRGGDVRGAVTGFGESIAPIQAAAAGTARSLYQPEFQRELLEFQREEREREKEEAEFEATAARRSRRDPSSETYRQATERLLRPQAGFDSPRTVAPRPSTTNYTRDILAGTGL